MSLHTHRSTLRMLLLSLFIVLQSPLTVLPLLISDMIILVFVIVFRQRGWITRGDTVLIVISQAMLLFLRMIRNLPLLASMTRGISLVMYGRSVSMPFMNVGVNLVVTAGHMVIAGLLAWYLVRRWKITQRTRKNRYSASKEDPHTEG